MMVRIDIVSIFLIACGLCTVQPAEATTWLVKMSKVIPYTPSSGCSLTGQTKFTVSGDSKYGTTVTGTTPSGCAACTAVKNVNNTHTSVTGAALQSFGSPHYKVADVCIKDSMGSHKFSCTGTGTSRSAAFTSHSSQTDCTGTAETKAPYNECIITKVGSLWTTEHYTCVDSATEFANGFVTLVVLKSNSVSKDDCVSGGTITGSCANSANVAAPTDGTCVGLPIDTTAIWVKVTCAAGTATGTVTTYSDSACQTKSTHADFGMTFNVTTGTAHKIQAAGSNYYIGLGDMSNAGSTCLGGSSSSGAVSHYTISMFVLMFASLSVAVSL